MTEDLKTTYETVDSLQLRGEYAAIQRIAQYAVDALANDGQLVRLLVNGAVAGDKETRHAARRSAASV